MIFFLSSLFKFLQFLIKKKHANSNTYTRIFHESPEIFFYGQNKVFMAINVFMAIFLAFWKCHKNIDGLYKKWLKAEVGIRDKGPRDPASRSRIFGTGTGTGTDFQLRARDRDRRSGPARDPGRDAGLKIEKSGTRDGTRDRLFFTPGQAVPSVPVVPYCKCDYFLQMWLFVTNMTIYHWQISFTPIIA